MISNHNKNMSSFRIIEPKPYQQAQQVQIGQLAQQQIPMIINPSSGQQNGSPIALNPGRTTPNGFYVIGNNPNMLQQSSVSISNSFSQQHPFQNGAYNIQHHHQSHQQQTPPRIRNLSDTDSSCIPGNLYYDPPPKSSSIKTDPFKI